MTEESEKIQRLRDTLMMMIRENIPKASVNGSMGKRLPGNLNMSFSGANNEAIISGVPEIAISSGAACTSSTMEASHVLLAMGLSKNEAYSALRFGIGRFNTKEDIEIGANSISRCMQKLEKLSYV
jgi:cysteine desulfurase